MRHTGKIDILATALEPIVHSAGTSGNTATMRMQKFPTIVDGRVVMAETPIVSGNTIKHRLRVAAVQYALDAMGIEDGTLTKAEVDLLFSGGHLNKSGAAVDLTAARKLSEMWPALSMSGYSAGNAMESSGLEVHPLHVVCLENATRVPDELRERDDVAPFLEVPASTLIIEEFGTRHDQATSRDGRRWLTEGDSQAVAARKSALLAAARGDETIGGVDREVAIRMCTGKTGAYPSQGVAADAALRIASSNGAGDPMRPYECGVCHLWHLTSQAEPSKAKAKGASKAKGKGKESDNAANARGDSAQMIYDFHAISAGAKLWGRIMYRNLTDLERAALASAFHYASTGQLRGCMTMGIGAKNSIGFGSIAVEMRASMRIASPRYEDTALSAPGDGDALRYTSHLRERRDEIMAAVREAVS